MLSILNMLATTLKQSMQRGVEKGERQTKMKKAATKRGETHY